jgi:hypothetical protein
MPIEGSENCTEKCAAMPRCNVCHKTKKPFGRSAPLEAANGYCDYECPGYSLEPKAGHLWPEEWRDIQAERKTREAKP